VHNVYCAAKQVQVRLNDIPINSNQNSEKYVYQFIQPTIYGGKIKIKHTLKSLWTVMDVTTDTLFVSMISTFQVSFGCSVWFSTDQPHTRFWEFIGKLTIYVQEH